MMVDPYANYGAGIFTYKKSGDFGQGQMLVNVGKYSGTMEHMGIVNNVQMPVVVGMNLSVFLVFWMYLVTRY